MTRSVLVLALAISAAGCKHELLDHARVEHQIADALAGHKLAATVACPGDRPQRTGEQFTCEVAADNKQVVARVTEKDDDGGVDWKLAGVPIDENEVGHQVAAKIGHGIDVQCDYHPTILRAGDTLHCATANPDGTVDITAKDDGGHLDWRQPPPP